MGQVREEVCFGQIWRCPKCPELIPLQDAIERDQLFDRLPSIIHCDVVGVLPHGSESDLGEKGPCRMKGMLKSQKEKIICDFFPSIFQVALT